jgi:hypothetical protein
MPTAPRKPLLVNLAWAAAPVMLLAIGYVASYPIALRIIDHHDIPAYRPVQRLIDSELLDGPMCWWAGFWGVDGKLIAASLHRKIDSGEIDIDVIIY